MHPRPSHRSPVGRQPVYNRCPQLRHPPDRPQRHVINRLAPRQHPSATTRSQRNQDGPGYRPAGDIAAAADALLAPTAARQPAAIDEPRLADAQPGAATGRTRPGGQPGSNAMPAPYGQAANQAIDAMLAQLLPGDQQRSTNWRAYNQQGATPATATRWPGVHGGDRDGGATCRATSRRRTECSVLGGSHGSHRSNGCVRRAPGSRPASIGRRSRRGIRPPMSSIG